MKKIILFLVLAVGFKLANAQYAWNNVGPGTNLTVQALAPDTANKVLYLGGIFTQAGTVPAIGIAKWDGVNYSALGTGILNGTGINSLVMFNGDLIAGGTFANIGGVLTKNIARWNGAAWSALGSGLDSISAAVVTALAVYNGELYAGGIFNNSGGFPVSYISKWSGTNWVQVGTGTNGQVLSLCVYNGELYAGGVFTNAGGVAVKNIAHWNGVNWGDVGGGLDYTGAISVSALQVYSGGLYAGGTFDLAGGSVAVRNIAYWNGTSWGDVGGGATNYTGAISVSALQVFHNELVTAGSFDTLGTVSAKYIGKWNGTTWSPMGQGMNNNVYALAVMGDTLYAGGLFTTADGAFRTFIAQWQPTIMLNSIDQAYVTDGFTIFPNPALSTIKVSVRNRNNLKNSSFTFVLTDALGREVTRIKNIQNEINFDRSNMMPGVYMYKILDGNNTVLQQGKIVFAD